MCWTFYIVSILDYEFKIEQVKDINRLNIAATHLQTTKAVVYLKTDHLFVQNDTYTHMYKSSQTTVHIIIYLIAIKYNSNSFFRISYATITHISYITWLVYFVQRKLLQMILKL
jgi:hypothetical protein